MNTLASVTTSTFNVTFNIGTFGFSPFIATIIGDGISRTQVLILHFTFIGFDFSAGIIINAVPSIGKQTISP